MMTFLEKVNGSLQILQTLSALIGEHRITLKMAARNFLPRCTAFFNGVPIKSLKICNSNTMHLGENFLATILSVIPGESIKTPGV